MGLLDDVGTGFSQSEYLDRRHASHERERSQLGLRTRLLRHAHPVDCHGTGHLEVRKTASCGLLRHGWNPLRIRCHAPDVYG